MDETKFLVSDELAKLLDSAPPKFEIYKEAIKAFTQSNAKHALASFKEWCLRMHARYDKQILVKNLIIQSESWYLFRTMQYGGGDAARVFEAGHEYKLNRRVEMSTPGGQSQRQARYFLEHLASPPP